MDESSQEFRDHLYTIDEKGKRIWVFAKKPKGKLTRARNVVGILLMLFLFSAPFIKINGQQLLLFDFVNRIFVIFGMQFWAQDFQLFFLGMIALMVFIILFTATYGRLWCGWACPQTIFMELIFRRIEYWIDGNHNQQKELDAMPWNGHKIFRRALKHSVFFLISFFIGNIFLMYLMSSDHWMVMVSESPAKHILGFTGMIIFSFIFYFIFSWFREQVCTIVCPYGRLQGVLLDRNTVLISYDYKRGEDRAPFRKHEVRSELGKGDCIDCKQCVQVCPTGVDIRNGTQLECINCACCIDACNEVMSRVGLNSGLIRYASEKTIAENKPWNFTFRSAAYTVLLLILLSIFSYFLISRHSVEATVMRSPGMLFQEQGNGKISNLYDIKILNKTNQDLPIEIRLLSPKGKIQMVGTNSNILKQSVGEMVFFVIIDQKDMDGEKTKLEIGVFSNEKELDETHATFLGPQKK